MAENPGIVVDEMRVPTPEGEMSTMPVPREGSVMKTLLEFWMLRVLNRTAVLFGVLTVGRLEMIPLLIGYTSRWPAILALGSGLPACVTISRVESELNAIEVSKARSLPVEAPLVNPKGGYVWLSW